MQGTIIRRPQAVSCISKSDIFPRSRSRQIWDKESGFFVDGTDLRLWCAMHAARSRGCAGVTSDLSLKGSLRRV
jgi:hypothetical protein